MHAAGLDCRVHAGCWQLSGSAATEGFALHGTHAPGAAAHCVMQCTILTFLYWARKHPNTTATAEAWHHIFMRCVRARSDDRQHGAEEKCLPDSRPYWESSL